MADLTLFIKILGLKRSMRNSFMIHNDGQLVKQWVKAQKYDSLLEEYTLKWKIV